MLTILQNSQNGLPQQPICSNRGRSPPSSNRFHTANLTERLECCRSAREQVITGLHHQQSSFCSHEFQPFLAPTSGSAFSSRTASVHCHDQHLVRCPKLQVLRDGTLLDVNFQIPTHSTVTCQIPQKLGQISHPI